MGLQSVLDRLGLITSPEFLGECADRHDPPLRRQQSREQGRLHAAAELHGTGAALDPHLAKNPEVHVRPSSLFLSDQ